MKTLQLTFKVISHIFMLATFLLFCNSCRKDDELETISEAPEISALIENLSYNANDLLNVNDENNSGDLIERDTTGVSLSSEDTPYVQGVREMCGTVDYNLKADFTYVAILRPTNGIIWPGALVIGDKGMLDGMPNPITLDRAPVTLSIDLPGMGENGTVVVENPQNSNVQSSIDDALERWHNSNEGYTNASNSSYAATTSYSKEQLSIDVGLNYEWATGDVQSQLNYTSSAERRAATMVYKQVFYTITMDTPSEPSSVFGADVTLAQVDDVVSNNAPPAYINSVSYGRIVMVKLETEDTNTSVDLAVALEYANGTGTVAADLETTYKSVLQNSTINVVTIGGDAEAASELVNINEFNFGCLADYITENAEYSRNNPGVPIAYTIRYLKDNSFAKMGYTTDYSIKECYTEKYVHGDVSLDNNITNYLLLPVPQVRFYFEYKKPDTDVIEYSYPYPVNKNDPPIKKRPPDGAHSVIVHFEVWDVTWVYLGKIPKNYITVDIDYEAYCCGTKWGMCNCLGVRPI